MALDCASVGASSKAKESKIDNFETLQGYANEFNTRNVDNILKLWDALMSLNEQGRGNICEELNINFQELANMVAICIQCNCFEDESEEILKTVKTQAESCLN